MRLNAAINSQLIDDSTVLGAPCAADRTMSKAELYRFLRQDLGDAVQFTEPTPSSWVGRLAARAAAWLGKRVALGYEDAGGFHYGPPRFDPCHEIYD